MSHNALNTLQLKRKEKGFYIPLFINSLESWQKINEHPLCKIITFQKKYLPVKKRIEAYYFTLSKEKPKICSSFIFFSVYSSRGETMEKVAQELTFETSSLSQCYTFSLSVLQNELVSYKNISINPELVESFIYIRPFHYPEDLSIVMPEELSPFLGPKSKRRGRHYLL